MTIDVFVSLLQKYADSPVILAIVLCYLAVVYLLKPMRRVLGRASDIMEEYFAIHEKEVGQLQRLCDRLDSVIEKFNAPSNQSSEGALKTAYRRFFSLMKSR